MNHIPAIGNTKSGIHAGGDVLWAAGSTDASGNLLESLSYDPWGRRRKATDWTDYNVTSTLFDRGFTGHEHLPHFGLINMNGRVYDPFLARFLSPDPFVQAPNYSQNYNRYSYAFNNPLKYTDPDGEWVHLALGAMIGGYINLVANAKKVQKPWQAFAYFGVGAVAGGLSAGIGAGVGAALAGNAAAGGGFAAGFMGTAAISSPGFVAGAISGAAAGFTNGLVSGTGNQLIEGKKFGDAFVNGGLDQAWRQGLGGAAVGGILGGIDAKMNDRNFWTGSPKQDVVGNNYRIISKADYDNLGNNATKEYYDTFVPENPNPFSVEIEVKGMKEIYPDRMTWQPKSTFPYSEYTVNGNKVIVDFPTGNYADGVLSIKGWRWQHSSQHYGRRLPSQYIYSRQTLNEYGGIFFFLNFLIK